MPICKRSTRLVSARSRRLKRSRGKRRLLPDTEPRKFEIESEDFGAVVLRMGERARGAYTASQVSAGRKNRLSIEIYGTKSSVAWDQEKPDELWIGHRNTPNGIAIKDPSLLSDGAREFAELPGRT